MQLFSYDSFTFFRWRPFPLRSILVLFMRSGVREFEWSSVQTWTPSLSPSYAPQINQASEETRALLLRVLLFLISNSSHTTQSKLSEFMDVIYSGSSSSPYSQHRDDRASASPRSWYHILQSSAGEAETIELAAAPAPRTPTPFLMLRVTSQRCR